MAPQPVLPNNSTGPRTEAGKAASSRNAFKHGLASGTILIPGEDPGELNQLETALTEQYQPTDAMEVILVEAMVKHHWLKDRALRLQGEALALAKPGELPATFAVLLRYQTTNERAFYKALNTLQTLRKEALKQQEEFVSQQADREYAEVLRKVYTPMPRADSMKAYMAKMGLDPESDLTKAA